MFPPQPGPDRDLILAHAPYVRGLARRLVFDAELAKDLEQEVLMAALENAPRDPRSIKGWLASVLRHLASKAFRSGERRAARETALESPAVPTPDEILAREDQRRALVEHVLALDESLRDVLVLRYFEDLPPRAVARRLGIPVETVRTRTKRGLELVRARLERDGGSRKGTWCLALVSALKLEPPSLALAGASIVAASLPGVVAMSLSKKIALAAVVLASATWITLKSGIPAAPERAPVSAAPQASTLQPPPSEAKAEAPAEPARTAISTTPLPVAAAEPTAETGSLLLSVRWFDGTPARGVNARVHEAGTDFYADVFDVQTGVEGTCRIEELNPGQVSLFLDRGLAARKGIQAGAETTVDFEIPRGFDISGRVVEPSGRAVADADILLDQMGGGWNGFIVARSDANGRFLIRSAEEGIAWVSARATLHAPSPQRELQGSTLAVDGVDLVVDSIGASLEGLVLGADGHPLSGARLLVGQEDAYDQLFIGGGRARIPAGQAVSCDERGHFMVPGVPIGKVPVQARAPGHAPWAGEVETFDQRAAHLEIRLERGSTLTGRVTDGAGKPVAKAEVHSDQQSSFVSRYSRTTAEGTFSLRDLPAGKIKVSVEAEGLEGASAVLEGASGAELTWNPVLGAGGSIRGRLVMADEDLSKWYVTCQSQEWARSPFRADVHPSADGTFEILGCADVPHTIEVHAPEASFVFPAALRKDVKPNGPELVIEIERGDLPSCLLRGRIVDELGEPLAGINFSVCREGDNVAPSLTAGQVGEFEVGPYPAGRYRVAVNADEFASYLGEYADVAPGASWDFGEVRLQRGGTISVHLMRDPALAQAEVTVSALRPGASQSEWMPLQDDDARSETLLPGEYVVRLRGRDASIAQRTARVTVRAGEEATAELRVESGILLKFTWSPEDVAGGEVQLFDASGALVCEDRLGRYDAITVPRSAVRLRARSDDGRSADVALELSAGAAEQSVSVELK